MDLDRNKRGRNTNTQVQSRFSYKNIKMSRNKLKQME